MESDDTGSHSITCVEGWVGRSVLIEKSDIICLNDTNVEGE